MLLPWLIAAGFLAGAVGLLVRGRVSPVILTGTAMLIFAGTLFVLSDPSPPWAISFLTVPPFHLVLAVQSSPLADSMAAVTAFVALMAEVYALGYFPASDRRQYFQAVILAFTGSMLLTVWGRNLLTQFVGWEFMGVGSYLLVGFFRETPAARLAASKSLLITHIGDLGFLVAVVAGLSSMTGSTVDQVNAHGSAWVAWGLVLAVAAKSAQGPFASWLLDAMAGPTPASALIHAATMVAAGPYLLIRYFPLLTHTPGALAAVSALGALTAVLAAAGALGSHEVKRLLAHSTLSQLGIMLWAVGIGAPAVAWVFLTAHAAYKALLFFVAGIASLRAQSGRLDRLRGSLTAIERGTALLIGVLALAGWPPTGGFVAKLMLFQAAASHPWEFAAIDLLITGLSGAYAGRLWVAFGGPAAKTRSSWWMLLPVGILGAAVVATGAYHPPIASAPRFAVLPAVVSLSVAALGAGIGTRWHRPFAVWTGAGWRALWSALGRLSAAVRWGEVGVDQGVIRGVTTLRVLTRMATWPVSGQAKRYVIVSGIFLSILVVWTFG